MKLHPYRKIAAFTFSLPLVIGMSVPAYANNVAQEVEPPAAVSVYADIDADSVEELFSEFVALDDRNFMHLNETAILESQYRNNLEELRYFAAFMNELNARQLGIQSRDAWSFAKCVVADAVGLNIASRLSAGLVTAIRAAQWPLAAKTILQIGLSAGLNLGWKGNAIGLAIALGKSAIYCRDKW